MFCDAAIRKDLRRDLIVCPALSCCRTVCAATSLCHTRTVSLVRERTYAYIQAHYDPFAMHSGTYACALWPARLLYFRLVILTTCERTRSRRRRHAFTPMWSDVRHAFAQCCGQSFSRVLAITMPVKGDASLTGWMRSDCPTWTACIGRKNMGAARRAVPVSRRTYDGTTR